MTAESAQAIQLQNVQYAINEVPILKSITGSLVQGSVTALVGPSGAGKTTLFALCNGLKSPDAGTISVLGQNIDDFAPATLRRTVGVALQDSTMIPGSVKDNLELPLVLQQQTMSADQATELLQAVGLPPHSLHKDSKDLSGGERQKLVLARTLVNKPEILLLDEITSSLDPASEQQIETLIAKLNREQHTTVVWITHSLEQALRVGEYVWVMIDGKLVASGSRDVLKHPADEQVQRFVKGEAT